MFILNIYVTCVLRWRRGRQLPHKPCRELLFVLSLPFLPMNCSFVALPVKDLSTWRASCNANSPNSWKYIITCGHASQRKSLPYCILTGRYFHRFCTTHCFASSADRMHSLNSDHALTLHQIWDHRVVAQHSLLSWPGDTSKGFLHRRDTSWGLGKQRQIFPALAPLQRL